jgi:hypothetical protein
MIASFLQQHRDVSAVYYSGHLSHKKHDIAKCQQAGVHPPEVMDVWNKQSALNSDHFME